MALQKFTVPAVGEAVVAGRILGQSATYIDAATSIIWCVTFESADSGAECTGIAPGSSGVTIAAAGTIAAGDLLKVTTDGKVIADNSPTTGEWVAGVAETAATSGTFCIVSFSPYIA